MNYEKMKCPVCSKPLDDPYEVVVCPECGAPHHRDCWAISNHCFFEEQHGTDEQWTPEKADASESPDTEVYDGDISPDGNPYPPFGYRSGQSDEVNFCSKCGSPVTPDMDYCKKCGSRLRGSAYTPMPVLPFSFGFNGFEYENDGGEKIEDVPVRELRLFIRTKSDYYISKFREIVSSHAKVNWNFSAFLLPKSWLLYRRMAIPFLIVTALSYAVMIPALISFGYYCSAVYAQAGSSSDMGAILSVLNNPSDQVLKTINSATVWMYVSIGVRILIHICVGCIGNLLYKNHCIKTVSMLRANADVESQQYRSMPYFRGGARTTVPVVYAFFAYTLCNFIVSLFVAL